MNQDCLGSALFMQTPNQNPPPVSKTFPPENVRVLIVDDQHFMRTALRRLLEVQPFLNVCGEAHNGYEAVEKAIELKPQVIVMDIHMPGMDGLEATRRIHKTIPDTEVVIFTQYEFPQASKAAEDAGALGCVSKSEAAHDLVPAITTVSQHQRYFPTQTP